MSANAATVAELIATLSALSDRLRIRAERVEAQMEKINAVVRSMGETGLLRQFVLLGRTLQRPYAPEERRDDSDQVVQAALLVPEGFGVCYWDREEYCELVASPAGLEPEARRHFEPFDRCTDEEKAFLDPFVKELLEDLHDTALVAASRLEDGTDVSADEYFGRANGIAGESASVNRRYEVRLRPAAQRDVDRLPKAMLRRIHEAINALALEPRGTQTKKILTETDSYRRRVGDYRIIYEIDDGAHLATVHAISHRKDAYR